MANEKSKIIFRTHLLTFRESASGLSLVPTALGRKAAKEMIADRTDRRFGTGSRNEEADMLEDAMGNGWSYVAPEDIGAMTDATIISQDGFISDRGHWVPHPMVKHPKVFAHMNYAVEDPIETWAAGKPVWYVKSVLTMTPTQKRRAQKEWESVH
jgi:hypothetical protein